MALVTSKAVPSSLFILASSVCKPLQYLTSSLVIYLGLLVQLCCGEGGTLQANITAVYGECLQCLGHTEFAHTHGVYAFPVYTAQAPGCSAGVLSKVGPGLCALPRSKPLRFESSGTTQRHRLSWACVLCPSQVPADQVTRCLVSVLSPDGQCILYLPGASHSVSWVRSKSAISGVPCVSSGELISDCDPPGRCQLHRIPGRLG